MQILRWAIASGKLFWFPVAGLILLYAMNTYETPLPKGFGKATGLVGKVLLVSAFGLYMTFAAGFIVLGKRIKSIPMMVAATLLLLSIPAAPWTNIPLLVATGALGVSLILAHQALDDIRIAIAGWLKVISGMVGIAFGPTLPALMFVPALILELRVLRTYVHRNTRRLRVRRRKEVQLVRDKAA